ncbi:MAG: VPLPA-CTERM sorting domain-containing protein [Paracoccaceae bacterium]|nr:VPLPA-CTERM sorting domain-containing protein [Paracoccaceae bacterium]
MFKKLALVAVLAAGTALPAAAASVFVDTFAYGPTTVTNAPDSLFAGNWQTTGGTVDYLNATSKFGDLCAGAPGCIDLDGSTSKSGLFSTVQTFAEGVYSLTFQLGGSRRGSIEAVKILFGNLSLDISIAANEFKSSDDYLALVSHIIVGPGGSTLSFQNGGGDNIGAILKSVSIDSVDVAAVPLPAAGGLMIAGLGALGALRRRKARG